MNLKTPQIDTFFHVMHLLTKNGKTLTTSLEAAKSALPKREQNDVTKIIKLLDAGTDITAAFEKGGFPPFVGAIIESASSLQDGFDQLRTLCEPTKSATRTGRHR